MLYFRAKDIELENGTTVNPFTIDVLLSKTQNAWIEILPMSKDSVDFISFIDLADRITKSYVVSNFSTRGDYIKIKAVHIEYQVDQRKLSFKFDIKKDFSEIKVYVRDGLDKIEFTQINDLLYIYFRPFSNNNDHNFNIFSKSNKWNEHIQYKNSVIYVFGNYISKKQSNTPLFLKAAFEDFLDDKTIYRRANPLIKDDIITILNNLPGYVYYQYTDFSKVTPYSIDFLKKKVF